MSHAALHWVCDSASPYNSDLFRALAAEPDLGLCVHYRRSALDSHPWQAGMRVGYRSRVFTPILGVDWHLLGLGLSAVLARDTRPRVFVIANWNHATVILLLLILGLGSGIYMLWTDTPNQSKRRNRLFAWSRNTWLRWIFRRAYRVMGTGQPAVRVLADLGAPAEKLMSFPYWIDLKKYRPTEVDEARRRPDCCNSIRFLSIGRVENALKGHDVAIRALARQAKSDNSAFEYRIAGCGRDEEQLMELAGSLGIRRHVKLLGWLDPEALIRELKDAHVLIHPSPVLEPYGVAVIEAMAAGLVVLASDATCAALDRITNGANGYVHRAGDEAGLAEQIASLLQHPDRISQVSKKARITAELWPMEQATAIMRQIIKHRLSARAR